MHGTPDSDAGEFQIYLADDADPAVDILEQELRSDPPYAFRSLYGYTDIADPAYVVASLGGVPVGVAVLQPRKPEFFKLYVARAYRGRGIGSALADWVFDDASVSGSESITVATHPSAASFVDNLLSAHKHTLEAHGWLTVWF